MIFLTKNCILFFLKESCSSEKVHVHFLNATYTPDSYIAFCFLFRTSTTFTVCVWGRNTQQFSFVLFACRWLDRTYSCLSLVAITFVTSNFRNTLSASMRCICRRRAYDRISWTKKYTKRSRDDSVVHVQQGPTTCAQQLWMRSNKLSRQICCAYIYGCMGDADKIHRSGNKYIFMPAVIVIYLKIIASSNRSIFLSLPVPIKNAFRFSFSICFRSRNVSHPSSSAKKKRKLRVAFTFRCISLYRGYNPSLSVL